MSLSVQQVYIMVNGITKSIFLHSQFAIEIGYIFLFFIIQMISRELKLAAISIFISIIITNLIIHFISNVAQLINKPRGKHSTFIRSFCCCFDETTDLVHSKLNRTTENISPELKLQLKLKRIRFHIQHTKKKEKKQID